jgi:hypothetical protein
MIMAPRFSYADAPALDRVIVLSSRADAGAVPVAENWNQRRGQPLADLLTSGAGADFAYDAIIGDIAEREGGAVARSDSVNLVYPVDPAIVSGSPWTPILSFHPLGVGLFGVALCAILFALHNRTRPARRSV